MGKSAIRVLIVDDNPAWRRFVASTLQNKSEFQVVGEVGDGLESVHRAEELNPDLVIMDIGLPTMNGIEATRRIRNVLPMSQVVCLTENRSWDIAQEALRSGAAGYVVKADAGRELWKAIEAVLQGMQFVSASLIDDVLNRSATVKTTPARPIVRRAD